MCTLSWRQEATGYELFMNRDELRQRLPARPPALHRGTHATYLAATDGDAGGSWLAVNEHGLGLALLNRYDPAPRPPAGTLRSRGLLVIDLAGSRDEPAEVFKYLREIDLRCYRPLTLALFFPGEDPLAVAWNGFKLSTPWHPKQPLASSSYDPEGINEARRKSALALLAPAPSRDELMSFHRSHHPERGPYSPCMHRTDAATVSFTSVRVTPQDVAMAYADGPPCRSALAPALALVRHAAKIPA